MTQTAASKVRSISLFPIVCSAAVASLALAGCGQGSANQSEAEQGALRAMYQRGMTPMRTPGAIRTASSPSGAHLTYNGGRINAHTQVVQVLWGSGSYDSHVSGTGTPSMASFYQQFMSKTTLLSGLLQQYNTPSSGGTGQTFASGNFSSQVTITPSAGGSTVDDSAIQTELTAQIAAGRLPAPAVDAQGNAVTYYAIFFPPGVKITQGGSSSCVSGGFCAYHGTVAAGGGHNEYYYGVHPDMQAGSGCATGCGTGSTFGNYCSVASHELVEMMTDAEVGISTVIGPPIAWYDSTNGEIGDICNAQQGSFAGCDGQSYTYQLEFSNAAPNGNACVTIAPSCGTGGNDFSISASPSSVTGSGSSTISTAVTSGVAATVSLAVSGTPSGATASVSPTSVTAGGSSTLTINGGSAAAGTYTITVTGTEGSAVHSTSVTLTISGGSGGGALTNGGFETGSLSGWTSAGASESVVNSGCHGGTYCARLGSTAATNGDSTISQTFTAAAGNTGISLWYKETCPDTVTYDWALATLKDNTAGTTATLIAKACTTNAWTNVTGTVTAGHSYTVTLTSHDDNYASDPTYTLYDDVTLTSSGGGGGITNGGFESGSTGWTTAGTTSVATSGCHGGTHCAQAGSTAATNGDSSFTQTFTVPTGKSQLSVWYKSTCPDTVTYDWVTITLNGTAIVPKTCTTNAWTNITASVTAGSSYTLTLTSHDDNYSGDPTYTLFDDAVLN